MLSQHVIFQGVYWSKRGCSSSFDKSGKHVQQEEVDFYPCNILVKIRSAVNLSLVPTHCTSDHVAEESQSANELLLSETKLEDAQEEHI